MVVKIITNILYTYNIHISQDFTIHNTFVCWHKLTLSRCELHVYERNRSISALWCMVITCSSFMSRCAPLLSLSHYNDFYYVCICIKVKHACYITWTNLQGRLSIVSSVFIWICDSYISGMDACLFIHYKTFNYIVKQYYHWLQSRSTFKKLLKLFTLWN